MASILYISREICGWWILNPLTSQPSDSLYGDLGVEIKTTDGKPLKEDWSNLDPSVEPYIISPRRVMKESMDYEEFHQIISEEMENAGLTWSPALKTTRVYEQREVKSTPHFREDDGSQ